MSRAVLVLANDEIRAKAIAWIRKAKPKTRVEFKGPQRTLPQNDRFWAMLTDVATQVQWDGRWLKPGRWRLIFLDALKAELDLVPNLDGDGFVNIGRSSSDLGTEEMSDLMALIEAFGANHGVVFHWREP